MFTLVFQSTWAEWSGQDNNLPLPDRWSATQQGTDSCKWADPWGSFGPTSPHNELLPTESCPWPQPHSKRGIVHYGTNQRFPQQWDHSGKCGETFRFSSHLCCLFILQIQVITTGCIQSKGLSRVSRHHPFASAHICTLSFHLILGINVYEHLLFLLVHTCSITTLSSYSYKKVAPHYLLGSSFSYIIIHLPPTSSHLYPP